MKSRSPKLLLFFLLIFNLPCIYAQKNIFLDSVKSNLKTFKYQDGTLKGEGWVFLVKVVKSADVVLVGEEHGSNEIPALCEQIMAIQKPAAVVLEIDPYTAEKLNSFTNNFAASVMEIRKLPFSYSFYSSDAELNFAQYALNQGSHLYGLDQVSLLSSTLFFQVLAEKSNSKTAIGTAYAYRNNAIARDKAAIEIGKLNEMFLPSLSDLEMDKLTSVFANESQNCKKMIDQLRTSRKIYLDQRNGHASRISLMKSNLLTDYSKNTELARSAFYKFGANHMAQTGSFFGNHDLGNLVKALADAEGKKTLHILMLGNLGTLNTFLPSFEKDISRPLNSKEESSPLFPLKSILELQNNEEIMLIDLRPIHKAWEAGTLEIEAGTLRTIINGYDLFLIIPHLTASAYIK